MGGCCCRLASRTGSHEPPNYYHCPTRDSEGSVSLPFAHNLPPAAPMLVVDSTPDTLSIPPGSRHVPAAVLPALGDFIIAGRNSFEDPDKDSPEHKNDLTDILCSSAKIKEKLSILDSSIMPVTDEEDVCPTCLEEYGAENPRIITKCQHHFHLSCILEWFERSNTCAICDKIMEIDNMALFEQTV